MLKLDLPTEAYWVDMPHGVRLRMKPVTTAIITAAQQRAARLGRETAEASGGDLDEDMSRGLAFVLMAQAIGRFAIEAWEGVGNADGNALALTPDAVDMLMNIPDMASAFWDAAFKPVQIVSDEGNG